MLRQGELGERTQTANAPNDQWLTALIAENEFGFATGSLEAFAKPVAPAASRHQKPFKLKSTG